MGWAIHKIIWRGSALSVGIFLEIKTGFVEERSSTSLTHISLGAPTCVTPNFVKSLEHVRFIQDPFSYLRHIY
ncbi:hypothetical protein RDI58_013408 [Solanum bulbocastanum]|uniref:Uncharacterized protein n=1 Tax=Solanum bulbocastanum TaxID=147425 RepID=A0AAN8TRN3_SOLBU